MSDWDDDGKAKELSIPGIALPGLRDLKVQFVALIEFDLFLGPIVHINEVSRGSSYIKKLQDYQTLSEVYAGVARFETDTLTTSEDNIAIFRHAPGGNTDITSVLMISCISDADLDPIREIGQKAMLRSKGNPDLIGQELSSSLREYQSGEVQFHSESVERKVRVKDENRIKKTMDLKNILGFAIYDLDARIADLRFLPQWIKGKELSTDNILRFFDNQIGSIEAGSITSLYYRSIPLIATKVEDNEIYIIIVVSSSEMHYIQKLERWIQLLSQVIAKEWKYCSRKEMYSTFKVLNDGIERDTDVEYIEKYLQLSIKSERIRPTITSKENLELEPPDYLASDQWELIKNLDGKNSIDAIHGKSDIRLLDILVLLEWSKARNIVVLLQE